MKERARVAAVGVALLLATTACGGQTDQDVVSSALSIDRKTTTTTTTAVSPQHSGLLGIDMPSDFTFYQNDMGSEVWSYASSIMVGGRDPVPNVITLVDKNMADHGWKACPGNTTESGSWSDGTQKLTISTSTGLSTSSTTVSGYLRVVPNYYGTTC